MNKNILIMDSNGIFNIQFIISLMILLIIFTTLLSISVEEFTAIDETQNRKESRIITDDLSEIINEVYVKGDGYSREYELPSKINTESYVLLVNATGVYINSHYQFTYSKFFPQGILKRKEFYLEPGNLYTFINKNNSVDIIQNN